MSINIQIHIEVVPQKIMAGIKLLHLLVLFLGFSHLIISLNAIPVTKIGSRKHGPQVHQTAEHNNMVTTKKSTNFYAEETISERMDVELHDYPGSGANNRHTPKPQFGKCVDC